MNLTTEYTSKKTSGQMDDFEPKLNNKTTDVTTDKLLTNFGDETVYLLQTSSRKV